MGVVYKARHQALDRVVALKMILAGSHAGADELARFRTEAEAIARLHHPNIIQIYEVGEHAGLPFFSLEFCPGGSLEEKLNGKPLPPREAAALMETLARAMHAAHKKGVVHRDLKPANVLLDEDDTPRITDFGLARKLDAATQTATGAVMGTPSYMAPEQAGGRAREIGPAADVYALGAILYECLTGQPPFRAATPLDTIMQVVTEEPVPPRQRNARVDPDLEAVCLKCLAKAPPERYGSALALAEDLARYRAGDRPIHARPLDEWESAVRWARKSWITAILTVLAVSVLLLAYLVSAAFGVAHSSTGSLFAVAWVPGFLAGMAILVRPRSWVAWCSLVFLVITLGLPWVAWAILASPGAWTSLDRVAVVLSTVGGVIPAGLLGGLSQGIARWYRCDMLSVFFGGIAGVVVTTACCSCGSVPLLMALSPQGPFVPGPLGSLIALSGYLIGPPLGFCLGAVLTARLSSRRLAPR
jgi:hypothetical protein